MTTVNPSLTGQKVKPSASLTTILTTAFVGFTVVALIVGSSFLLWLNFRTQQIAIAREQEIIALKIVHQISNVINKNFDILESAVKLNNPLVDDAYQQGMFLQNVLDSQPLFREIILLDKHGQELLKRSRLASQQTTDLKNQANSELFQTVRQGKRYISTIVIDEETQEPWAWIAVPIMNVLGDVQGALVLRINLKFVWDLVADLQKSAFNGQGNIYIVDRQANLLAFSDLKRVLARENVGNLPEVNEFLNDEDETTEAITRGFRGINQTFVVGVHIPLGFPDWAVMTEMPLITAYQGFISTAVGALGFLVVVGFLSAFGGLYLSRRLARPLQDLTKTVTHIAEGNLNLTASLDGPIEVVGLAVAFNTMTGQLRELIDSLEQRVAIRTQRLELVATLSERLTAILDLEQLLQNLVTEIKTSFGYYHVHVYLLDHDRQNLVMTAGFGDVGAKMKAKGHQIPANAVTSLVARAARSGEIVQVDDVRQAIDWLANPLLPFTRSEMTVPISLAGQVVGVLDVQEDKVAGFDESDAALLRSLANQVAIAIRNARLFAEVEAALLESNEVQARYLTQSWHKIIATLKHKNHVYIRPNLAPLPQPMTAQAHHEVFQHTKPTLLNVPNSHSKQSLVAPICFMGQAIGTLQLHRAEGDEQEIMWGQNELAIVEAVVDQVAQAAENLRLFEETRERAQREQVIREITDKLRTAPNLNALLDIAARELGQRLGIRHTVLELGIDLKNVRANTGVFEIQK